MPVKLPPCLHMGDVNDDGVINILDVTMIELIISGAIVPTTEQFIRADVDANGIVDINDVHLVEQYIAGLISTFPVCSILPRAGFATPDGIGTGILIQSGVIPNGLPDFQSPLVLT